MIFSITSTTMLIKIIIAQIVAKESKVPENTSPGLTPFGTIADDEQSSQSINIKPVPVQKQYLAYVAIVVNKVNSVFTFEFLPSFAFEYIVKQKDVKKTNSASILEI